MGSEGPNVSAGVACRLYQDSPACAVPLRKATCPMGLRVSRDGRGWQQHDLVGGVQRLHHARARCSGDARRSRMVAWVFRWNGDFSRFVRWSEHVDVTWEFEVALHSLDVVCLKTAFYFVN